MVRGDWRLTGPIHTLAHSALSIMVHTVADVQMCKLRKF